MAASKSPRVRLLHIHDEIDGLGKVLAGVTFETYKDSYTLRRVAERALQIISEAAGALPKELQAQNPDAPWQSIISLGNRLRHEYAHLSDERLWEVATVDLPKLKPIILRMLAEHDEAS